MPYRSKPATDHSDHPATDHSDHPPEDACHDDRGPSRITFSCEIKWFLKNDGTPLLPKNRRGGKKTPFLFCFVLNVSRGICSSGMHNTSYISGSFLEISFW